MVRSLMNTSRWPLARQYCAFSAMQCSACFHSRWSRGGGDRPCRRQKRSATTPKLDNQRRRLDTSQPLKRRSPICGRSETIRPPDVFGVMTDVFCPPASLDTTVVSWEPASIFLYCWNRIEQKILMTQQSNRCYTIVGQAKKGMKKMFFILKNNVHWTQVLFGKHVGGLVAVLCNDDWSRLCDAIVATNLEIRVLHARTKRRLLGMMLTRLRTIRDIVGRYCCIKLYFHVNFINQCLFCLFSPLIEAKLSRFQRLKFKFRFKCSLCQCVVGSTTFELSVVSVDLKKKLGVTCVWCKQP